MSISQTTLISLATVALPIALILLIWWRERRRREYNCISFVKIIYPELVYSEFIEEKDF